jgi:hypothetical protein
MARGRGMPSFGPIIAVAFIMVFFMVTVLFSNVIFAENEASINMTEIENETLEDYNASTTAVQAGIVAFSAMSWLLVGAAVIIAAVVLWKVA